MVKFEKFFKAPGVNVIDHDIINYNGQDPVHSKMTLRVLPKYFKTTFPFRPRILYSTFRSNFYNTHFGKHLL